MAARTSAPPTQYAHTHESVTGLRKNCAARTTIPVNRGQTAVLHALPTQLRCTAPLPTPSARSCPVPPSSPQQQSKDYASLASECLPLSISRAPPPQICTRRLHDHGTATSSPLRGRRGRKAAAPLLPVSYGVDKQSSGSRLTWVGASACLRCSKCRLRRRRRPRSSASQSPACVPRPGQVVQAPRRVKGYKNVHDRSHRRTCVLPTMLRTVPPACRTAALTPSCLRHTYTTVWQSLHLVCCSD